jgi:outer membrane protein assembly factor BamB
VGSPVVYDGEEVTYETVAVADDRLFVAVDSSREAGLYALSPADGSVQWRALRGTGFTSGPTVAAGRVAVTSRFGQVTVVDAATGDVEWADGLVSSRTSPPAFGPDAAYLADDSVFAFDAETGDRRWRVDSGIRARSRPTVGDGVVFASGRDGVSALDPTDGAVRWQFRGDVTTDLLAGEVLFVGQPDGRVAALADC